MPRPAGTPSTFARFAAIFRAPPGRDSYAVLVADQPVGIER